MLEQALVLALTQTPTRNTPNPSVAILAQVVLRTVPLFTSHPPYIIEVLDFQLYLDIVSLNFIELGLLTSPSFFGVLGIFILF